MFLIQKLNGELCHNLEHEIKSLFSSCDIVFYEKKKQQLDLIHIRTIDWKGQRINVDRAVVRKEERKKETVEIDLRPFVA